MGHSWGGQGVRSLRVSVTYNHESELKALLDTLPVYLKQVRVTWNSVQFPCPIFSKIISLGYFLIYNNRN